MTGRLGAIVLAGGRSSRFGRDKLAEPLGGRALLDHAIDAVLALGPDVDVVVVAGPRGRPHVPAGIRVAHDPRAFEGPLAGVATGLAALAADVDRLVVVGGDMPTLVPGVLGLLVEALADADAAILDQGVLTRPLPMAARRGPAQAHAPALLATGERRLRALPEALGAAVVGTARWHALDPDGATLRDVDVEADLPHG
jgi:molybdopterin-guanine dinucleotide biosynthesis protein A